MQEVTLKEYATKYNPVLNRRGKPMSEGYLYRLIRQDAGKAKNKTRELWFRYKFTGAKDSIRIII